MITCAKVVFEVNVTLDIPEGINDSVAKSFIIERANFEILDVEPKITKCIERPSIVSHDN